MPVIQKSVRLLYYKRCYAGLWVIALKSRIQVCFNFTASMILLTSTSSFSLNKSFDTDLYTPKKLINSLFFHNIIYPSSYKHQSSYSITDLQLTYQIYVDQCLFCDENRIQTLQVKTGILHIFPYTETRTYFQSSLGHHN